MKFQRIHQHNLTRQLIAAVGLELAYFLQAVHGKSQRPHSKHHRIKFVLAA